MKKFLSAFFASLAISSQMFGANSEYPADLPKFIMGTCTHFGQNLGDISENMKMIAEGGFNSIRDECMWCVVEERKGEFKIPPRCLEYIDSALSYGLLPLMILDYSNPNYDGGAYPESESARAGFAAYSSKMAVAFKGKIKLWQVWNEWDGGCGMPAKFKDKKTMEGYAKLLKASAAEVKRASPDSLIVLNSICRGLKEFEDILKCGVIQDCDVLSLHTYNHSERGFNRTPEAWHKRMLQAGEIIRKYNGGKDMPLYVTEMGFTTPSNRIGYSYNTSADYAARLYLLARTIPWVKGMWWYEFQNYGSDHYEMGHNFGLIDDNRTPKPSYYALKSIADIITKADYVGEIQTSIPSVHILKFKLGSEDILAMWCTDADKQAQAVFKAKNVDLKPLTVYHVGKAKTTMDWGFREFVSARGKPNGTLRRDSVSFTISQTPLIVRGNLAGADLDFIAEIEFKTSELPVKRIFETAKNAAVLRAEKPFEQNYNLTSMRGNQSQKKSSGSFSASYDKDFLTFKISVKDGNVVEYTGQGPSDRIVVSLKVFDAEREIETATQFEVRPTADEKVKSSKIREQFAGATSEFVASRYSTVNGEHFYTIKIPASDIGLRAYEKSLRLKGAVAYYDCDDSGSESNGISWGITSDSWPLDSAQFNYIFFN